jgi:RecJ-like exonuclease
MIGDRHESNISRISQQILDDAHDLQIKKGLVIYPATRPLRRALEWSTSPYIPGVTGNGPGAIEILRETGIQLDKSLLDLTQDEMSKLITAVMIRRAKHDKETDILGNLYILKFFNTKEDVREISVLINACSRLGYGDIAISYCLGNEKAKTQALDIYTKYKQELVSGLRVAEKMDKIKGKGFVILNAKDQIKDAIVGTICSMLSSSPTYTEGTILIGMAYNEDKIKVSARIVGQEGRNLKEVLEKTVIKFKIENPESIAEVGGHHFAAGCLVEKSKEDSFIETLKKELEIEIVKV